MTEVIKQGQIFQSIIEFFVNVSSILKVQLMALAEPVS